MTKKYVFGSKQNAMTARTAPIIVPEDVEKHPDAWLDKRFPVLAYSWNHLGWYRYSKQAVICRDGKGEILRRDGKIMVRFFDRRSKRSVGEKCQ